MAPLEGLSSHAVLFSVRDGPLVSGVRRKGCEARKGAEKAHRLIKRKMLDDDSPREAGREAYYKGYEDAIKKAMSLIRDELIFSKQEAPAS